MLHEEIFQSWLNSNLISEEERRELMSLSENDRRERFSDRPYVFGTSGIRALTGLGTQRLNRFTYRLMGKMYANYLKRKYANPSILIVHDNRYEGQKYSIEMASVLKSFGVRVFLAPDSGALSTPILSYLIRSKKLNGGISITASHNPIGYNGLKIFNFLGKQLSEEEERDFYGDFLPLKQAIEMNIKPLDKSCFELINAREIDDYLTSLSKIISCDDKRKNIPILFSSFGGTTQRLMEKFAHMLNFPLFREYMQGRNDLINPEDSASFLELSEQAEKESIHYIMCADLDGDRSAIAELQPNKKWYFFNGNEMGVMLAHFKHTIQKKENAYIVSTHVTNTLIGKLLPNIPLFLTNTGFKHISEIVDREENKGGNLLVAFEEACGVLMHPLHREKDSYQQIGYALEMINYLHSENRTLRDYLEELRKTSIGYWRGWTDYYLVSREKMKEFMDRGKATQIFGDCPMKFIDIIRDGEIITWELENQSWIKFRYSGTEPKMKIYYNLFHRNKEELERWSEKIRDKFGGLINR